MILTGRFMTCAALGVIVGGVLSSRSARADRFEATIAVRPVRGSAELWETGTDERVKVDGRGIAASMSYGVRDWLDLGGEIVASNFDEAAYQWATVPISGDPLSGPLKRTTNIRQLRATATLHYGVFWVPYVQASLGLGARFRSAAVMYVPTEVDERWLITDQHREVSLDVVTGIRAGLERRLTIHWTAGISAAKTYSFGVFRPDLRTAEWMLSLSYSWYPLWGP